jgi:hypothetical protein
MGMQMATVMRPGAQKDTWSSCYEIFLQAHMGNNESMTSCKGCAIAQAVSCRHLAVEARVLARVSPCGICGGQSNSGTGFSLSSFYFPYVSIIPLLLNIHSFIILGDG